MTNAIHIKHKMEWKNWETDYEEANGLEKLE